MTMTNDTKMAKSRLRLLAVLLLVILLHTAGNPASKPYIPFRTSPFEQDSFLDHEISWENYLLNAKNKRSQIHSHDKIPSTQCPLQFSLGISKRLHSGQREDYVGQAIRHPPVIYPVFPARGPGRQVVYTTQYEYLDLLSPVALETPGKAVKEALLQASDFPLLMEGSSFLTSPILHDVSGDGRPEAILTDYDGGIFMVGLSTTSGGGDQHPHRFFHRAQVPRLYIRRTWVENRVNETLQKQKQQQEGGETKPQEDSSGGGGGDKPDDPYHTYFEYYYENSDKKDNEVLQGVSANLLGQDHGEVKALKERRHRRVSHKRPDDGQEEDKEEKPAEEAAGGGNEADKQSSGDHHHHHHHHHKQSSGDHHHHHNHEHHQNHQKEQQQHDRHHHHHEHRNAHHRIDSEDSASLEDVDDDDDIDVDDLEREQIKDWNERLGRDEDIHRHRERMREIQRERARQLKQEGGRLDVDREGFRQEHRHHHREDLERERAKHLEKLQGGGRGGVDEIRNRQARERDRIRESAQEHRRTHRRLQEVDGGHGAEGGHSDKDDHEYTNGKDEKPEAGHEQPAGQNDQARQDPPRDAVDQKHEESASRKEKDHSAGNKPDAGHDQSVETAGHTQEDQAPKPDGNSETSSKMHQKHDAEATPDEGRDRPDTAADHRREEQVSESEKHDAEAKPDEGRDRPDTAADHRREEQVSESEKHDAEAKPDEGRDRSDAAADHRREEQVSESEKHDAEAKPDEGRDRSDAAADHRREEQVSESEKHDAEAKPDEGRDRSDAAADHRREKQVSESGKNEQNQNLDVEEKAGSTERKTEEHGPEGHSKEQQHHDAEKSANGFDTHHMPDAHEVKEAAENTAKDEDNRPNAEERRAEHEASTGDGSGKGRSDRENNEPMKEDRVAQDGRRIYDDYMDDAKSSSDESRSRDGDDYKPPRHGDDLYPRGDDYAIDDPEYGYRAKHGYDYDDIYGGGYNSEHQEYYDKKHYIRIPPHILCQPVLAELPKLYSSTNEKEDILFVAVSYYLDEDEYQGFFSYKRFEETDHGDETEVKRGAYVASAIMAYIVGEHSMRWTGQTHLDLSTDYSAPENVTLVGSIPVREDLSSMGALALGSPTVADIDGDGNFEVLFGTSMGIVYCFDARQMYKKAKWPIQMKRPVESRILVEDVVGDTNLEVFVNDIGGNVVLFNHEASVLWHRHLPSSLEKEEKDFSGSSSMTLGDVNGDGVLDLVIAVRTGDRSFIFAMNAATGEDLPQFPIELDRGSTKNRLEAEELHEKLAQPLLVDLHADQGFLNDYIRRNATAWIQRQPPKSSKPLHGGSAPGLHIVYPSGKDLYIVEAGSGCTQKISIGDEVRSMVQVDDVHGTNKLDLVISTEAGDIVTLESASPYHPLNTWNHGELRGRMNAHAHGYSASQGVFVHEVSRQYIDIFGVYVPVTFEIFDNRPNIRNEPAKRKYVVEIRDGTSSQRGLFRTEYSEPGVYTERVYIRYGPGYYSLSVVLQTTHGLVYEDTFQIGYNVHFMNGFGILLWLPLIVAAVTILFCGAKKTNWEDEDFDGDREGHSLGILGRSLPT